MNPKDLQNHCLNLIFDESVQHGERLNALQKLKQITGIKDRDGLVKKYSGQAEVATKPRSRSKYTKADLEELILQHESVIRQAAYTNHELTRQIVQLRLDLNKAREVKVEKKPSQSIDHQHLIVRMSVCMIVAFLVFWIFSWISVLTGFTIAVILIIFYVKVLAEEIIVKGVR